MKPGRTIAPMLLLLAAAAAGAYFYFLRPPAELVLTGVVTTDELIVAPEIQGRLQSLGVAEGDTVTNGQLLACIRPEQWRADAAYYASSQQQSTADLAQARADFENARLNFDRIEGLYSNHVESAQASDAARATYEAAEAKVEAVTRQIEAIGAQKEKAEVYLSYTQIVAPTNGIVDKRTALPGEFVNPGQAILTLIDPDNLWVRADVEETYIDRLRLGDRLTVKLPSGATREGTIFYRGVDADYATQRDVSRTKRDIKTFEIRLRCDNRDRALAVGMTAYVALPLPLPAK
jgi:HlyD family secretion protein